MADAAPLTPRLLLASTSPQRRAILEQLGIPFDAVAPDHDEETLVHGDPFELAREQARAKARSVADDAAGRPVLGVDTVVALDGTIYGKPADAETAARMLERFGGETHVVVSGLCLIVGGDEAVGHESTRVEFRPLTARDVAAYVATGEWAGRAGGYAIQGRGAALVRAIEGDYGNVVGLPVALLVRVLSERFAGLYGFG